MSLRAVLTPWQEDAWREVCRVEGDVETQFHGWSKRVVLTTDRVFLFPRDHTKVEGLEREAAALAALSDCHHIPRLLARHNDERISPYPFLELERVAGQPFYEEVYEGVGRDGATELMAQLGLAIAEWHEHPVDDLEPLLMTRWRPVKGLLDRALTDDASVLAQEASAAVGLPLRSEWVDVIAAMQSLVPVLTHGDVHGEQLLVEGGRLTGVIDWESAAVDNPIRDFDFGEWGKGWYRAHEADFAILRERLWTAYATARSVPVPSWQTVHLFFSLIEAWHCHLPDAGPFSIGRRPVALRNLVDAP